MTLNKVTIIKTLELVLVCVLIGLHYHSFSYAGINSAMITMGTFGGYLIILTGIVIGIILGAAIDRRLDMFFSVVGLVLFVTSGALILHHFTNSVYHGNFRNTGLAKGSISLIEGALFLLDAICSFRGSS